MRKTLWFALLSLLLLNGAEAFSAISYDHTSGSHGYRGDAIDVRLPFASGFFLGGGYRSYSSDFSNGTVETYKAQGGQETANDFWRVFGSVTPEVGGYKDKGIGGDFSLRIWNRNVGSDSPTPHLDLIGGYSRFMISSSGVDVNEDDTKGGLGYGIWKTHVTGVVVKSVYDKDIAALGFPQTKPYEVEFVPAVLEGYPDYSLTGTLTQGLLDWLSVYAAYTHMNFKVGPDKADSFSVGTNLTLFKALTGQLQYTYYTPSAAPSSSFVSFSLGIRIQ